MDPNNTPDDDAASLRRAHDAPNSHSVLAKYFTHKPEHDIVLQNRIQLRTKRDEEGRRYVVLDHLPANQKYTANTINDGREFAIGGSVDFICDNLKDMISEREHHARTHGRAVETWHVVAIPNSNMSDTFSFPSPPRFTANGLPTPESLGIPWMYGPRPPERRTPNNQQAALPQENPHNNNLRTGYPQYPAHNQQPVLPEQNTMGGVGPDAFSRAQQTQYDSPMTGAVNQGGRSATMFPQGQSQFQGPRQGQGYNQFTGVAQGTNQNSYPGDFQSNYSDSYQNNYTGNYESNCPGSYQNNYPGDNYGSYLGNYQDGFQGQSNTQMFNNGSGCQMGHLVPVYKPVLDWQGNIIMLFGGYQQQDNQYQYQYQQSQYPIPNNPQLANDAQSFYNFCENKSALGQGFPLGQAGGSNNNANAIGTVDSNGVYDEQDDHADPSGPYYHLIRACKEEPQRFDDQTGSNVCDHCGRNGHEADACIEWDPVHFDKAVCTACNNVRHSLDECPKFRAMSTAQKQALLLGAGARRPGVRSVHHPWTSYVHPDYRGPGFPLSRQILREISGHERLGPVLRNMWKVWDYSRGVPDEFRDPGRESVRAILHAALDETFRVDDSGQEGDEMQS